MNILRSRIGNPQHVPLAISTKPFFEGEKDSTTIISLLSGFTPFLHRMETTLKTLELASSISNFDIIELWYEDAFNSFECKFSYATEAVQKEFESVIVGHYPHHSREHKISPEV